MPNIIANIPNFVSGVSQQPRTMRFPSQAEESINTFPSVVEGLTKRPPAQHIKRLLTPTTQASSTSSSHFIDRSETEKYITEIREGKIRVWDLDGTEKLVYYGGATPNLTPPASASAYLTGNTDDFKMLTIADYTFVLNKTAYPRYTSNLVTQSIVSTTKNRRIKVAMITFKQIIERCTFNIRIGTTPSSGVNRLTQYTFANTTYLTPQGANQTLDSFFRTTRSDNFGAFTTLYSAFCELDTSMLQTDVISQNWRSMWSAGAPVNTATNVTGTPTDIGTTTGVSGWSFTSQGSTLMLWNTATGTPNTPGFDANGDVIWDISISDSASGALVQLNWEEVQSFSELPRNGVKGIIYKIIGYPQDIGDEYWVKFDFPSSAVIQGEGLWKETIAPGEYYEIDSSTMPWALVRLSSGNFAFTPLDGVSRSWGGTTYQPPKWTNKICGDIETNKSPSFLNLPSQSLKRINDIFFYKNRLGFLSEENIIFSESG